MDEYKRCTKCGQSLPANREYYQHDRSKKDGWRSSCKKCDKPIRDVYAQIHREEIAQKTREWAKKNPEKAALRSEEYRKSHIEQFRLYRQNWVNAHPIADKQAKRKWEANNKQKVAARGKRWRKNNPIKARAAKHRRRARELAAEGSYDKADIDILLVSQGRHCWWCGRKLGDKFHIDHIIPLSRGGSNWPANLCISCPKCNLEKSSKTPAEFMGRLL